MSNPYIKKYPLFMIAAILRLRTNPYEWEQRFVDRLNIEFIQKALWLLLTLFILFNFWDTVTTLDASALSSGFVELNPLGAALFRMGFAGFMIAYLVKFVPVVPLFYMVAFRWKDEKSDFPSKLRKYTAFVVLVGADIFLGVIVFDHNLPLLMHAAGT